MGDVVGARLWLVRHGQTDWNLEGRVQGQKPTGLNATGFEQARELAGFLKGRKFAAVWASDLPRAYETADVLAEQLGLVTQRTEKLRERSFGEHEGKTAEEVRAILGPGFLQAAGGGGQVKAGGDLANWTGVPGVESNASVWERTEGFLRELSETYAGEDVLVVTHGGVVARAIYNVLGIAESTPRHFALSNGLVVIVQRKLEVWHLLTLVDVPLLVHGKGTLDTATSGGGKGPRTLD